MATIAVLGAGAFGTALAIHCATRARAAPDVLLYARGEAHAAEIRGTRANARYLCGFALPPAVSVTARLADAMAADLLLAAVPAAAMKALVDGLLACNRARRSCG